MKILSNSYIISEVFTNKNGASQIHEVVIHRILFGYLLLYIIYPVINKI